MLSVSKYNYATWQNKFSTGKVTLVPDINSSWYALFSELISDERFGNIEEQLSKLVGAGKRIYPYPDLLFNAFKLTSYDNLKVVIVGQDPYFKSENGFPQAMGLSFSVPRGIIIPSSLDNIYKNMIRFGNLSSMPKHGNLEFWAYQGCLMLNTTLSVNDGEPNSHNAIWKWFTDKIIKKISDENKNIIFVLWGNPALEKANLIDQTKHKVIVSSHPSGLSFDKPLKTYPAFRNCDHFGQINQYLSESGKEQIIFGL